MCALFSGDTCKRVFYNSIKNVTIKWSTRKNRNTGELRYIFFPFCFLIGIIKKIQKNTIYPTQVVTVQNSSCPLCHNERSPKRIIKGFHS